MSSSVPEPRPLSRSLASLSPYFAGHGLALAAIGTLAVAAAALAACEPLLLRRLFDGLLGSNALAASWPPFVGLALLLTAGELAGVVLDRLVWRTRLAVDYALMHAAVERLHSLPLAYHRDQSVGATMTRIERGVAGCMGAFSELALRLVPALVYLCVSVVVMLRLEWRLSLVVLAFAPLPAAVGAFAAREQIEREQGLLARWQTIFARFNEVLSGIVVVKSFVMEEREKRRFLSGVQGANQLVLRGVQTDGRQRAIKNTGTLSARLLALGMGGYLVVRHEISLGTLLALVSYLGGVFQPVQTLTGMYQMLRRAGVSLESLLSILEAEDSLGDAHDAIDAAEAGPIRGAIEFRDLSFGYLSGAPVLSNIELSVRPGELIALVGPSGAGKTTLMALLQRLYDPSSGAILLDGRDLRSYKQRTLRAQIGVVLQDGVLFSDSVHDNIAFGRPGATRAEVEAAAKAAFAHDFITALPQGYDTPVGERGTKLSGGERQRIAIARALLKDAPILILDEATSALDAEAEDAVQEALARLIRGRTTFVIAHRLSTIVGADRIAVLRGGRIAELGTHLELMQKNGYYANLVQRQMRGLAERAA